MISKINTMTTMILCRWTSRENLLTAAGDEDGDPQLFVSLYDFQVFNFLNNPGDNDDVMITTMTAI